MIRVDTLLVMKCPHCTADQSTKKDVHYSSLDYIKKGSYRRKSDSRHIQRFYCKRCKKTYSLAYNDPAYNQKKRRINYPLKKLLASCISMRRAALILGVTRKTVSRKLIFLGTLCREEHQLFLESQKGQIEDIQFDELQTIEHTKCKPLSVAVAVSSCGRKIVGAVVSSMPATGYLAKVSFKKYGKRPDHRREGLRHLLKSIHGAVSPSVNIYSDKHPYYRPLVSTYFPEASYYQTKGAPSAVTGQGELKKQTRDPLFYINHTQAMLRANINRLVRKTWCTTKDPDRLSDHLAIYMSFHNSFLTA